MSAQCVCKKPTPVGEGEQEHCTNCGAWTSNAIAAHYARKEREGATARCGFCGSAKHTLADCPAPGAPSYRDELANGKRCAHGFDRWCYRCGDLRRVHAR